MDSRIDDVSARNVDRAGDAVEDAGMVGGVDRHQCGATLRIDLGVDGQLRVADARHESGIVSQHIFGLCDPISFREASDVASQGGAIPAHRCSEPLLLRCDPLLASALLVAETQDLFCGAEQIAQQLPLPAVPGTGAHRTNIDDG